MSYGLAAGHAYTIIGCYEIKDSSGRVIDKLIRLRNPWATDKYNGPWNERDPKWQSYSNQVPQTAESTVQDGEFYMPVSLFKGSFFIMTVTYYYDDYQTSYYEATSAVSNAVYKFTI